MYRRQRLDRFQLNDDDAIDNEINSVSHFEFDRVVNEWKRNCLRPDRPRFSKHAMDRNRGIDHVSRDLFGVAKDRLKSLVHLCAPLCLCV
jgi:hypothetical protein